MAKLPIDGGPKEGIEGLRRRIEKLEKELKRQRSSSSFLQNATIGRGGLTIKGGGSVTLEDGGRVIVTGGGGLRLVTADGIAQFEVISDANNPDPDGNPQPEIYVRREDGTAALSLDDPLPLEDGYRQILRLWDREGHEIFAEDATSGHGIANPWLPFSMYPARYTDWPKSTSGTFEEIYRGNVAFKNPTVTLGAGYTSDNPDTSGEVRFKVNGTVVGTTQTFGFAIGATLLANQEPLPAGVDINDFVFVTLEVRRTAGTGNVMTAPYVCTGSQSA